MLVIKTSRPVVMRAIWVSFHGKPGGNQHLTGLQSEAYFVTADLIEGVTVKSEELSSIIS